MNLSQNILVRTDLGFSMGLMAAQVAHIHATVMRTALLDIKRAKERLGTGRHSNKISQREKEHSVKLMEWLESPYIFVRGVPNPETLEFFIEQAMACDINVFTWNDTVFCEVAKDMTLPFQKVLIGASFGPDENDRIKAVVGKLPLL